MMTVAQLGNVAVLLSFWLPAVYTVPCGLSIHPMDPVVPFGGSVTLNCTSSCANNTQPKWEFSVQGEVHNADGWTSVRFTNLTVWDFQPVCYRDSADNPAKMPVYLYQFSSPDIYLAPEIKAGFWHIITCNVSSLKVRGQTPQNINISLSTGGRILNSTQGNSSVEYTSVAQSDEDGAEILCVAHLEVGNKVLEKRAGRILKVSGKSRNWVTTVVVVVVLVLAASVIGICYQCRK